MHPSCVKCSDLVGERTRPRESTTVRERVAARPVANSVFWSRVKIARGSTLHGLIRRSTVVLAHAGVRCGTRSAATETSISPGGSTCGDP